MGNREWGMGGKEGRRKEEQGSTWRNRSDWSDLSDLSNTADQPDPSDRKPLAKIREISGLTKRAR